MAVSVVLFDNVIFGFYPLPKHLFISLFPHEWLFTCFMIRRKSVGGKKKKKRSHVLNRLLFY